MPGTYQYDVEIKSNVAKLLSDMKQVQDRLDTVEGREYTIKLNIDEKKLSNVISNLEKMLDSLGKGTGDFKQFENLSKELSSIVSEVQSLSKAFGKVDDSGTKTLLSSIQNIDKSLSELSQNILNVNKNMSNMGNNTSGAVKQVENITNESKKAASALEDVAKAQEKVNGQKTNISSGSNPSIETSQNNNISSIQKKKEALASYELQLEETRYEVEKLSKSENEAYGFNRVYNDKKITSLRDSMTKRLFGEYDSSSGKDGSKKWLALGDITNIDTSTLKSYQMWQEELQKVGYTLSEIKQTSIGLEADIIPIDGKAITNAEEFRKTLDSITTLPSENVQLLNKQIAELESKISSLKSEITSLESSSTDQKKDAFQGNGIDNSKEQLAIDKQLTKELESQAKAQQKKWQSFQKENEIYQKKQSEVEAVKRNKDAYEELANAIKQYSEVSKRVSGRKAEDGDIEKMTQLEEKISQLQKQPILSDSQVAKSESALVSLYDQLDKIEKKLQETNQKQVDSGFSKLSTYQGKVDKYQATINRFNDGGWTSNTYSENVKAVENAVKEYETLLNELKGKDASLVTSDEINKLDSYEKKIKDTIATVTNMSASEKGYNFVSGQKELDKIHKLLNENSKMSSEAKAKIKAYYAEIESGNPSMSLDKIHGEILKIYNAEVEAGRAGRTLWDTLKNSGFHQIAAQMAGMFGVYDVINVVRQGVNTVRELDTAMTEVRKVSNATEGQYDSFRDTISSTAKEIATTNKELLNSSADFLRLGYSLDQASDLAKNATLFVNVGDGVDITEATEDMITAMKAFDIQAEDSIKIVDDYNQIGNRFALSASDIGEAMKRSASALETGNNSFEQSIGLITAMNEIVQNSENTGNSLKVLSLRLRGAKAELKDMQEDTDGLCDSTSKLREQIKSLTGVDIMLDDNTFKSTTDIIKELGAVWDKLSDSSQAATLELIAGKSRANNVAALLKNYQKIDEVMESLGDAEGSAMRENEAIVDSINGRIKVLSATAEEFWQNFIDTDLVKELVSLTSDLLNILTKIVNIGNGAGTLGLIGTGAGIFKFIKNFDWVFKPYTKLSNSF